MKTKKSWREKLAKATGELTDMPPNWVARYGPGKLLIPDAAEMEELIKKVRKGKTINMSTLREKLAERNSAAATCPLTTGIFFRMIAEAAEEERADGAVRITPWWRVVRDDGKWNEKLPGSGALQRSLLKSEGVEIPPRR